MKYDLVKDNTAIRTKDFTDTPPTLSVNKGKWLERIVNDVLIDPNTQKKELTHSVTATQSIHTYTAVLLSQSELDATDSNHAKNELAALDFASIRDIREWVAAQLSAPQTLKDRESLAVLTRARVI